MTIFNAHERDRLQVFIDGPSLYATSRVLHRKMDYKAFMELLKEQTRLIRVQYFTTIRPEQDNDKFHGVLNFLEFNGYHVETKSVYNSIDASGHVRDKGSMVGEMTVAMLSASIENTDHIVLFSGNREMVAAVNACKARDTKVTVVSSERYQVIAEDLRRACDDYVDMEELPTDILIDEFARFRHERAEAA